MDDSIDRLRTDQVLFALVLALLGLGLLMVQSAAMNVTGNVGFWWSDRGTKHAMYAGVAVIAFLIVSRFDYRTLLGRGESPKFSPALWALITAFITCVAVLIPHVGLEVNGARRWLPLGPLQLQPSELAKWSIVGFLAWWLARRPVDLTKFWRGFVPTLVPVGAICLLVVIQDFGTAVLIGCCAFAMLLVGRVKLTHLLIIAPPILVAAAFFVAGTPYRWRRMTSFLDPWADPRGEGYHMTQSLMSFASGGLLGRGLGNGVQKLGYLPEDTTDFIFSVVCEELGLFGALLVITLYLGILLIAFNVVRDQRYDPLARLLAFGLGIMLALQATINIAVATVSVPTKGLSLPLISAGGSGLIITCAALGLLASVLRYGKPIADAEERDERSPTLAVA